MSHYAVLVIGKNVKSKLAKFDENLEVKRYVENTKQQLIEKGRKEIEEYAKGTYAEYLADPVEYALKHNNVEHVRYLKNEFPKKLEWSDEEVYQDQIDCEEEENIGEKGEVYSTRNPNSKWDWYTIGGRYRDRFVMKQGCIGKKGEGLDDHAGWYAPSEVNCADIAVKGDIDWSKTHQVKSDYDKAIRFWEMKIEGAEPKTDEEKETIKWDWYKPEYYTDKYKTKETYATAMSNFTMWAIVIDGKWYEKGGMGWFGLSDEEAEVGLKWELEFYDRFIKDLPDDTLLTVVDCHI